ncbi:hypothetical protein AU195_07375 [Mycobacterium sp. IS-1496]|uniref:hypothetical protein n=1 Tax=Mycobacterium sp. IS-1496 TaxID=1772284 RepID=UPI00074179DC|nr:hypothetical protein [Mycobacterium sp. IS-1496]KUI28490.1 hypothetical protein AU195_07375 [Mycobacterium sp. IS-1496]
MSAAHRSAVVARRGCALLAAVSAGLHVTALGHAANPVAGALLAVMILGCLYCAHELWAAGTTRAWLVVALMNIAMIAVHLPAPAHDHGGPAAHAPAAMSAATALAVVEVTLAATVLYFRTRHHGLAVNGGPDSPG